MTARPDPGRRRARRAGLATAVHHRVVQRWLRAPFGRVEGTFYETTAAEGLAELVGPELRAALEGWPGGPVLDVGCGGGAVTRRLASASGGGPVVGVDPSGSQVARLARHAGDVARGVVAGAEALPFPDATFATVATTCAVKHWRDREAGLDEVVRVLRPRGRLVVVEIDGGRRGELRAFAEHTRMPRLLRPLYPLVARATFVPLSPSPDEVADALAARGLAVRRADRLAGLPMWIVVADR